MGIKVTINGKDYPCRMTMGAMVRFEHETGHDLSKMNPGSVAELAVLIWACTASACVADKVKFEYSFQEFADNLSIEDMNTIGAALNQGAGAEPEDEEKKSR